jgi:hypothetical protein
MPHSNPTYRCQYCGAVRQPGKATCSACDDLPALEQLDDLFLLTEEE